MSASAYRFPVPGNDRERRVCVTLFHLQHLGFYPRRSPLGGLRMCFAFDCPLMLPTREMALCCQAPCICTDGTHSRHTHYHSFHPLTGPCLRLTPWPRPLKSLRLSNHLVMDMSNCRGFPLPCRNQHRNWHDMGFDWRWLLLRHFRLPLFGSVILFLSGRQALSRNQQFLPTNCRIWRLICELGYVSTACTILYYIYVCTYVRVGPSIKGYCIQFAAYTDMDADSFILATFNAVTASVARGKSTFRPQFLVVERWCWLCSSSSSNKLR